MLQHEIPFPERHIMNWQFGGMKTRPNLKFLPLFLFRDELRPQATHFFLYFLSWKFQRNEVYVKALQRRLIQIRPKPSYSWCTWLWLQTNTLWLAKQLSYLINYRNAKCLARLAHCITWGPRLCCVTTTVFVTFNSTTQAQVLPFWIPTRWLLHGNQAKVSLQLQCTSDPRTTGVAHFQK